MKQGMRKRGKSRGKIGHQVNDQHFTGPKGSTTGSRVRRKGKGLTRKQRQMKRGTHVNKYAEMKSYAV